MNTEVLEGYHLPSWKAYGEGAFCKKRLQLRYKVKDVCEALQDVLDLTDNEWYALLSAIEDNLDARDEFSED